MFARAEACCHRSSSFLLIFVIPVIAGCGRSAGADKAKEAPRVTVTHPVVRRLADEDDYNGWLAASQTVEVRARVRGHIEQVAFKDGDYVQKNQLLFNSTRVPSKSPSRKRLPMRRRWKPRRLPQKRTRHD
jgi:multidrug efflux pump subunit AcrA (membrane-fusion protein)